MGKSTVGEVAHNAAKKIVFMRNMESQTTAICLLRYLRPKLSTVPAQGKVLRHMKVRQITLINHDQLQFD